MAENKKSFVLYADLLHMVSKLPDNKAGKLLKHILEYVNDKNPTTDDVMVQIAFEPIKQQLKRDLIRWEQIRTKRSDAGKASANKRQQNEHMSTHVEFVEQNEHMSTVSVNATVNVNDNVTVIDNTASEKKVEIEINAHQVFLEKIFKEEFEHDRVNVELGLNPKRLLSRSDCEQFNAHLYTEGKQHVHWSEWKKHLRNWLNTKPNTKNGTTKQPTRKGHDIAGINDEADRILQEYTRNHYSGGDNSTGPDIGNIEEAA